MSFILFVFVKLVGYHNVEVNPTVVVLLYFINLNCSKSHESALNMHFCPLNLCTEYKLKYFHDKAIYFFFLYEAFLPRNE